MRYFPSTVIATTCTFSGATTLPSRPFSICSHRQIALGFAPGIRAALMNPGGFIHKSSWYRSASSGEAATGGPSPSIDHEYLPLVRWVCRRFFCVGVPSTHPRPYFHDAGFRPGLRSKVSLLVPVSQLIVRV
jgi:hypothetical protein